MVLARVTRPRCIVHVHVGVGEWMNGLLRWGLRHADALVAVSGFVAETLVETGHRAERIHVVHNAIEPTRWEAGADRDSTRAPSWA